MAAATIFEPEQDIAARVAHITGQDSALMRQARTSGMQAANRRGLANSSMGIGAAQAAALGVATPIASQEASEANAAKLARAQITSTDRNSMLDAEVRTSGSYNEAVASIMANTKLSATARSAALASARSIFDRQIDSLSKAYGVRTPMGTPAPVPAAAVAPVGIGGGVR